MGDLNPESAEFEAPSRRCEALIAADEERSEATPIAPAPLRRVVRR
ncbi:hypothetical protein [Pseudorhodoplanes sp.]|nr:hypothetical protein [Pseudorhodoplanes sp.]HWV41704.1 hypothetical protein [Pseudorhodoplanes sp.]